MAGCVCVCVILPVAEEAGPTPQPGSLEDEEVGSACGQKVFFCALVFSPGGGRLRCSALTGWCCKRARAIWRGRMGMFRGFFIRVMGNGDGDGE